MATGWNLPKSNAPDPMVQGLASFFTNFASTYNTMRESELDRHFKEQLQKSATVRDEEAASNRLQEGFKGWGELKELPTRKTTATPEQVQRAYPYDSQLPREEYTPEGATTAPSLVTKYTGIKAYTPPVKTKTISVTPYEAEVRAKDEQVNKALADKDKILSGAESQIAGLSNDKIKQFLAQISLPNASQTSLYQSLFGQPGEMDEKVRMSKLGKVKRYAYALIEKNDAREKLKQVTETHIKNQGGSDHRAFVVKGLIDSGSTVQEAIDAVDNKGIE